MGEKLFLLIRQIGIFMICAQMLLHFKASETYGKYIRLLMSMMVLIQLSLSLAGLLHRRSGTDLLREFGQYEELVAEKMTEINQTCLEAEALLETFTLEEIKERIEQQEAEQGTLGEAGEEAQEEAQEETDGAQKIEIDRIAVSWGDEE